jgi:hypothetical protein
LTIPGVCLFENQANFAEKGNTKRCIRKSCLREVYHSALPGHCFGWAYSSPMLKRMFLKPL